MAGPDKKPLFDFETIFEAGVELAEDFLGDQAEEGREIVEAFGEQMIEESQHAKARNEARRAGRNLRQERQQAEQSRQQSRSEIRESGEELDEEASRKPIKVQFDVVRQIPALPAPRRKLP